MFNKYIFRPRIDVELVPLRCKFKGYIKMLFKIPFTIFDWSADKLNWTVLDNVCIFCVQLGLCY